MYRSISGDNPPEKKGIARLLRLTTQQTIRLLERRQAPKAGEKMRLILPKWRD